MPQNQMGEMASGRQVFAFSLKWWLFIFVTVILPLDLLFRGGALWFALSGYQIAISLSGIVVCLALLALSLAAVSWVFSWPLNLLTRQGTAIVIALNAVAGFLVLLSGFLGYFSIWLWKISVIKEGSTIIHWELFSLYILLGVLIVLLAVSYRRFLIFQKIELFARQAFRANMAVTLICSLIVLITVGSHQFHQPTPVRAPDATGEVPRSSYPNIIIITFDALSAKHTSLHGFIRDTSPNLAALGRESYVFDYAYAGCNWTLPSCYSLITGKYPINHRMRNEYSYFVGESCRQNLPFILQGLGYDTAQAWSNVFQVAWNTNLQGFKVIRPPQGNYRFFAALRKFFFDAGMGSYTWLVDMIKTQPVVVTAKLANETPYFGLGGRHLSDQDNPPAASGFTDVEVPENTLERAKEFLEGAHHPFFLWVHLYPPHDPYLPPKPFLYTFLKAKILDTADKMAQFPSAVGEYSDQDLENLSLRYDENIRYVDHEFGVFLSWLKQKGLFDQSLIMVSADHGEMFEKKFYYHAGPYLYQILINVPLVIHFPGQTEGKRLEANVSNVDLAPTILDILGSEAPAWMDGKSFKKALSGNRFDGGTKFSMNLTLNTAPPKMLTTSIAAIHGDYKLINYLKFKQYEMYDVRRDPEEKNDLVRQEPTRFLSLKKEIDEFLARPRAK